MKIYTTRKALMEGEGIKRPLFLRLLDLGVIKECINQRGKKVGFYFYR